MARRDTDCKKEKFDLKKALMILISLTFLMSTAFLHFAYAAPPPPELVASYSANSPIIDGSLGSAEWNDTIKYVINLTRFGPNETVGAWLYVKHNETHISLGLLTWFIGIHATDQFTLAFDEGNDGSYGSGTRDYILTPSQEDLKAVDTDNLLEDGYYGPPWYTPAADIDFVANITHENDHGTLPSEIENWEGLPFVDDHWECEFIIPFVGNEGASSDHSDLSFTVLDTIGMKVQYFHTGPENYYYPEGSKTEIMTYANLVFTPPSIESCDSSGTEKDEFSQFQDVYANGSSFTPFGTYDCYIVDDVTEWMDSMPIPARVPGTATSVFSYANGTVVPGIVWSDPATIGKYDMIVDVNGNGLYDKGIDALDDGDVELTAGFVIPEYAAFFAVLMLSTLAIVSLMTLKRKLFSNHFSV